jgi:hypothetical protein
MNDSGAALLITIVLGLILAVLGIAVFSLAFYEMNQTTYRDQSASAFWLADAAIEHAKGEIFLDTLWTAGFDSVARGEGWYNLIVSDTLFEGEPATYWYAQGYVPRGAGGFVERDIEVFADVGAALMEFALFSMTYIEARGTPGVCGLVHANEEVDDGGNSFIELADSCRGRGDHISDGFVVYPPGMRTEPAYYPNTTYYYVLGQPAHGAGAGLAWIANADTTGADPADTLRLRNGLLVARVDTIPTVYTATRLQFAFLDAAAINDLFHWSTGRCSLDTAKGDSVVIVNFGEYIAGGTPWVTNLDFDDAPAYPAPIRSSIFNTRYLSADTSLVALTDSINWIGGNNVFSHLKILPENGITLLIHAIDMAGPAQIEFGSPTQPGVVYITGSITGNFNANGNIYGTTIVLGKCDRITGTVDFHYDPDFQENLPPYLVPFWPTPPPGHVKVLLWREVPPRYQT